MRSRWLLQWAERAGLGSDVATAAAKIVLMGTSQDEIAAELYDLMGDFGFDAIQTLLAVRCCI